MGGGGVPGKMDSDVPFEAGSSGDGDGAQASVLRLRNGDFALRGVRDQSGGGGL